MDVKKNITILAAVWILVIGGSLAWNYFGSRHESIAQAALTAHNVLSQIITVRQWNIGYGGVYVPVAESTGPLPPETGQEREIDLGSSHRLMVINPALMTRQLSEIAEQSNGIKFHLTSLKPPRAENRPTAREDSYLKRFEQGLGAGGEFFEKDGETFYFHMAPLAVEQDCLACHADQGYKRGDLIGGISVTVPFQMTAPVAIIVVSHLIIGLLGLAGLFLVGRKLTDSFNTVKRQAVMDALTGIPNWRSFTESILREFNRSRRQHESLSIIMCDIDNFKAYNDCYGHSAGDECLVHVANGVKISLRRPTDFCARYGGEEFVVILPNTGLRGAMKVAERIRITIEEMKIRHKNSEAADVVTVSLGVAALVEEDLDSHESMIKKADMALYQAKKNGKNQVQYFRSGASRAEI